MGTMQWVVLGLVVAMYGVIIAKPEWKASASLATALLTILLSVVSFREAFTTLVNWNILMIYVGSLVIAELFIYSRAPSVLADAVIDRSGNVCLAIVAILLMTGIISAFVENVATVLVMAPICLSLSRKLKMDPTYFMVGLAVMANLQGTATLVGDPPSMIFANYTGYGFNDFFFHEGRFSIFWIVQIGMLAGAFYFWFFFRKADSGEKHLEKQKLVSIVPSLLLIAMIGGLALCSFFGSGVNVGSGLLVLSLGLLGLLWYHACQKKSWKETGAMVKGLDWETIAFLIGIFIVVGAIENAGLLDLLSSSMRRWVGGSVFLGFLLILLVSVIISGFVDNVPYIMVMLPVADHLARSLALKPELYMFALLVGSCLGGNLTPFGASANIVSMGILRKNGVRMSFLDWLKIGLPFTLLTTMAASACIWMLWR